MNKSEAINDLAAALAKAQSQMTGAIKDSANPFFKSKYADLASVWEACRKPLSDNGLSVTQMVNGANLDTLLMHASGQWVSSTAVLAPVKNDPQGMGSCISYMRRYCLAAIVGVFQQDDDAESAVGRNPNRAQPRPSPDNPGAQDQGMDRTATGARVSLPHTGPIKR